MTPRESARLLSIHIHPVKAFRGQSPREVVMEPWGLAGDRRWALIDDGGKVVTQRQQPRLAPAAAELLPGGGLRLSAPGLEPLTVAVPEPVGTVSVEMFRGGGGPRRRHGARLVQRPNALPCETVTFADGYPLPVTAAPSLDPSTP